MSSYEKVLIEIQAFSNTVVHSLHPDHFSVKADQ